MKPTNKSNKKPEERFQDIFKQNRPSHVPVFIYKSKPAGLTAFLFMN